MASHDARCWNARAGNIMVDIDILALRQTYRKHNNLDPIPASLGDENGAIRDPHQPGKVAIREYTDNGLSASRYVLLPTGTNIAFTPGADVWLGYDRKGRECIIDPNSDGATAKGEDPVASVAAQSSRDVSPFDIQALVVLPANLASLMVSVRAWNPIVNGVYSPFKGKGQVDLTDYVPASGYLCYAALFVTDDYLDIEITSSTPELSSEVIDVDAHVQECLDAATNTDRPVWAIQLVGGQTTIKKRDIKAGRDLRQLINTASSIGGGTGSWYSVDFKMRVPAYQEHLTTREMTARSGGSIVVERNGRLTVLRV